MTVVITPHDVVMAADETLIAGHDGIMTCHDRRHHTS
jgi:hypothetical protein